jgi:hypothetical protein
MQEYLFRGTKSHYFLTRCLKSSDKLSGIHLSSLFSKKLKNEGEPPNFLLGLLGHEATF